MSYEVDASGVYSISERGPRTVVHHSLKFVVSRHWLKTNA